MRLACLAIGLLWPCLARGEVLYRLPWAEGLSFMFIQAPGGRITTHFTKATQNAVDIAMPEGVTVLAARAGTVEAVEGGHGASRQEDPLSYEGNFVRVRHPDGTAAIYAHLRHHGVAVSAGQVVVPGQLLGYSGSTGDVPEPQLYFAVVRAVENAAGWQEEVSLPITFYVGAPPVAFQPRAALRVTANYSAPAEWPRAPSEGASPVPWKRPALAPGEENVAWGLLFFWLACAAAGLAWFCRFSNRR